MDVAGCVLMWYLVGSEKGRKRGSLGGCGAGMRLI
jgi:hypothetical protein